MSFKVYDVKGDGHCYYRCIYRLAKVSVELADALYINHVDDEEAAIREIRYYVSKLVRYSLPTHETIANLIMLYKELPELASDYPILKFVNRDKLDSGTGSVVEFCEHMSTAIEKTNVYASSVEHNIVRSAVSEACDIDIIILHRLGEHLDDLVEKWEVDLEKAVKASTCEKIAVLVNQDHNHYQYVKINGKLVLNKEDVLDYLEDE